LEDDAISPRFLRDVRAVPLTKTDDELKVALLAFSPNRSGL
jgi:hypothetical protein